jgi:hypothetical protein
MNWVRVLLSIKWFSKKVEAIDSMYERITNWWQEQYPIVKDWRGVHYNHLSLLLHSSTHSRV